MIREMIKRISSPRDLISASVTTQDIVGSGRRDRVEADDLVSGFAKWVAVANSRNAVSVASLPLRVMRRTSLAQRSGFKSRIVDPADLRHAGKIARIKSMDMSEQVSEITDPMHPLVSLLRQVNPYLNGFELVEQTESMMGLTGDAFWSIVRGPRWPVEIWPLAPQYVEIIPSKTKYVEGYRYGRDARDVEILDADDVIHFRRPNPTGDPFRGFGDLQKCLDDANLSIKFTQIATAAIDNGLQPGLVILAPRANEKTARDIERRMNAKHAGPQKAGKTVVLYGSTIEKIERMTLSDREVQFLQSDQAVREIIAAAHDIPVELLTLRPGGLSEGGSALPQWQRLGVLPRAQRIEDKLNERLVPMFADGLGDDLFVVFDSPVEEDGEAISIRAGREFRDGIRTRNEARSLVNLPAVPDGDVFVESTTPAPADPLASIGGMFQTISPPIAPIPASLPSGSQDAGDGTQEDEEEIALSRGEIAETPIFEFWSRSGSPPDKVRRKQDDHRAADVISPIERRMSSSLRSWILESVDTMVRAIPAEGEYAIPSSIRETFLQTVGPAMDDAIRSGVDLGQRDLPDPQDEEDAR